MKSTDRRPLISVVLPLFNEVAVLTQLADELRGAIHKAECRYELLFINDGSTDNSALVLDQLAATDSSIRALHLSRNFGHQAAVHAGLQHAQGDAVVVMDTDLQDDPAAIPHMIGRWREGYEVVYAVRAERQEAAWKRALFFAFYRLLNLVSDMPVPKDAGNFSLLDRRAAQHVASLAECDRYFPGLRNWIGFRQIGVPVRRLPRHDEHPRVSLGGLVKLAKTAIFSFSRLPLTMFYVLAGFSLLVCGACAGFTLYHRLFTGLAVPGWTSITIIASLFGALNSLGIGILGEYVSRIYDQVRGRPGYIVARYGNADTEHQIEERLYEAVAALRRELESAYDTQGLAEPGSASQATSEICN
jgi:dolichol-phosphate mannosyltransferase